MDDIQDAEEQKPAAETEEHPAVETPAAEPETKPEGDEPAEEETAEDLRGRVDALEVELARLREDKEQANRRDYDGEIATLEEQLKEFAPDDVGDPEDELLKKQRALEIRLDIRDLKDARREAETASVQSEADAEAEAAELTEALAEVSLGASHLNALRTRVRTVLADEGFDKKHLPTGKQWGRILTGEAAKLALEAKGQRRVTTTKKTPKPAAGGGGARGPKSRLSEIKPGSLDDVAEQMEELVKADGA